MQQCPVNSSAARRYESELAIFFGAPRPRFDLVGVWEQLDEIGVSTSHVQLIRALDALAGYGLLQEQEPVADGQPRASLDHAVGDVGEAVAVCVDDAVAC